MITDFRTVSDGSQVDVDLCIIGAGAAGITIAREFIGHGAQVCLLEGGGLEIDADSQSIYEGENIGQPYYDLDVCRLRFFGGTTNHWEGWCRPLSELDFEARPHVPLSGWPITREELDPFYRRAHPLLELGPFHYDSRFWQKHDIEPPEFQANLLHYDFWRFSPPTRFASAYKAELEQAGNVRVFLNANVTNLQANADASLVDYVDVRSPTGNSARVTAKSYVLACGGLENPRLLLLSNSVESQGLGNRYDQVGRYFMEHPRIDGGIMVSDDNRALADIFDYRDSPDTGVRRRPTLTASRELQQAQRILNGSTIFEVVFDPESGSAAARSIARSLRSGRMPSELGTKIWRIVTDIDDVAVDTYRNLFDGRASSSSITNIRLSMVTEQSPNPHSRVTLGPERDSLGLNRIQLDWRLTEMDKRTIRVLVETVGREMGRLNLGRVKLADWLLEGENYWPEGLGGGKHHIGTTRMASDPKQGVVDKHCRVHGIGNLYVGGSSVFSTSGYAAPTESITALALRLADRLKETND